MDYRSVGRIQFILVVSIIARESRNGVAPVGNPSVTEQQLPVLGVLVNR
jgi:hypothetical protein